MRNITTTISQIQAAIPTPFPAGYEDNLTVLTASLRIAARVANYTPPESDSASSQWADLERTLYRYMPPVTFAPWCQDVSNIITNAAARGK